MVTPAPTPEQGLLRKRKGRVATMAERRQARQRLREEIDNQMEANPEMSFQEAGDAALAVVEKEFAGLDWATLLPFLLEFIMALLEAFGKRQA